MTTLIWQTSLILLCAYFLGAWVACLLRRMLGADAADDVAVMETAAASPGVARASGPPARRPDPKPIAIETIQRTAPQATAGAAKKFEEVLTTAPKATPPAPPVTRTVPLAAPVQSQAAPAAAPAAPVPTATQTAAQATAAPAPTAALRAPAAPAAVMSASTPSVAAAPVAAAPVPTAAVRAPAAPAAATAPVPTPTVAPASSSPSAAAGAAVAAAAAAAEALRQASVQAAKPAAAPAPAQPSLPAASSGAGPAVVSAPTASAQGDDLTRIRPIDAELQKRLSQLGITRYQQIAGWQTADVNRISAALGFKGRIEQENWIEQAQILSRGGETAFTRRLASGQVASAAPTANEGQPKTILPAAPKTAAAPPAGAAPVTPVAATRPEVASRAAFGQAPAAPVRPAAATPAPAATPTAKPTATPAPAAMAPIAAVPAPAPARTPSLEAVPGMAAAAASAAAAGLGAAATSISTRDNLQRISGINAEVEKLLNVQGITRYSQMATWTPADVLKIDRMLGYEGRVAKESWIEQASLLARGSDTAFSRQFDQRGTTPRQPLTDMPRAVRVADPVKEAAPAVARPNDMSTLRSVRSEAYSPPAQRGGASDDLKRIRGVGVLIEKKLNSIGITTYAQVANWSSADIDRVSNVLDFKGRIERENWVEQARILSAGGQTEFSRRIDRGEAGQ